MFLIIKGMYFSSGVAFALCNISFIINFIIKLHDFKKINAIGTNKSGSLVKIFPIVPKIQAIRKIGNHRISLIIKKVISYGGIEG
jgi:hypothetical protein